MSTRCARNVILLLQNIPELSDDFLLCCAQEWSVQKSLSYNEEIEKEFKETTGFTKTQYRNNIKGNIVNAQIDSFNLKIYDRVTNHFASEISY